MWAFLPAWTKCLTALAAGALVASIVALACLGHAGWNSPNYDDTEPATFQNAEDAEAGEPESSLLSSAIPNPTDDAREADKASEHANEVKAKRDTNREAAAKDKSSASSVSNASTSSGETSKEGGDSSPAGSAQRNLDGKTKKKSSAGRGKDGLAGIREDYIGE